MFAHYARASYPAFLLCGIVTTKTRLATFVAIAAAVVATGCGPADHSSDVRNQAGDNGTVASSAPSTAPAAPQTAKPVAPKPVAPKPVAPKPTAAAPKPKPKPVAPKPAPTTAIPAPKPAPKPVVRSTCGAPSNPWGYNFCGRGSYIYAPAAGVCSYFDCIGNFANGVGYMVECNDGMYSMSGGRHGACSYHGGENQPVYSGP